MANKCSVSMKVSGPSEALKTFIYATLKHRTNGQKQSQKLCFTLEALVPCDVDEDPYECWGCYGDVLGDVTLQDMKWTEGCESVVFEFQTLNAPPLHWLYKVAAMYPRLTIDMGAVEYLLGINMSAHAENGKVTEDWADSPEWEDVEAPDEEEGLVCEIRSVPDEEFLYELDEMDEMGLWDFEAEKEMPAEEDSADAADLDFFQQEIRDTPDSPALDWHGFADKPAGVFVFRNGTPCELIGYRAAQGLPPLSMMERAKLLCGIGPDQNHLLIHDRYTSLQDFWCTNY